MKAYVLENGQLKVKEMPDPVAGEGEVVVTLKAAGLNRRDTYIKDRYDKNSDPLILGSDGAGIVESIGPNVNGVAIGDEVIINPSINWYDNTPVPPKDFSVLGMPAHGTFAEKIVISASQIEPKPAHLSWGEAGVLALAALTGWRALMTQGKFTKGQTVFLPGCGSGVISFIILFVKHTGGRVIVTSRSEEKREKALELGADVAIDTNGDWLELLTTETIDLVIESVGGATFNRSLDVLKQGGRIVTFGSSTNDVMEFDLRKFFYGQYEMIGSTMGSREELKDMLAFINKEKIWPVIDRSFSLENTGEALDYIHHSKQFGKISINI